MKCRTRDKRKSNSIEAHNRQEFNDNSRVKLNERLRLVLKERKNMSRLILPYISKGRAFGSSIKYRVSSLDPRSAIVLAAGENGGVGNKRFVKLPGAFKVIRKRFGTIQRKGKKANNADLILLKLSKKRQSLCENTTTEQKRLLKETVSRIESLLFSPMNKEELGLKMMRENKDKYYKKKRRHISDGTFDIGRATDIE
eukprot:TRINITY_DN8319_c0_g2_i2.p2 TRINITY_DN8319_c0_g2~~TRINITY_DN8319_c0_g2_i2.p2  ORF type:complete len:198 (-),score=26.09 TRINITY_DN8319_c0_g2_i2:64-657(-)